MNSQYEGLSLPELLDLMHEIVVPNPVSWLPATEGWWALSGWAIAMSAIALLQLRAWWRRNRYRREAVAELDVIARKADADPAVAAADIAALIKRTALAAFPREQVASLYGTQWAQFISATAGNDPVVADLVEQISVAAYRSDVDGRMLINPARRWIQVHRA